LRASWYPGESEGLDDEQLELVRFACLAIDSGVTTSGSRFITGLTLAKTEAKSGAYRRMGVSRLGGLEGIEYFLGKETQQIVIV
jgi:transposase-like protein